MILAPFGVNLSFCICIIAVLAVLCKKLFPLCLHDCAADLPQTHLCNIAGGNAQGIDGGQRIEIVNMGKFVRLEILVRPQAQAGQQQLHGLLMAALQKVLYFIQHKENIDPSLFI
ncbi:MAG: hypothetical protein PUF98_04105 [Oscillibacter sp.]|nr:hypothetical protein [Oscillibacter sp.]